jgi:signal transduction histidine kinase
MKHRQTRHHRGDEFQVVHAAAPRTPMSEYQPADSSLLDIARLIMRHQVETRVTADALAARTSRLLEVTTALSDATSSLDVARVIINQGLDVLEATAGLVVGFNGIELVPLDWRGSATGGSVNARPGISIGDNGPLAQTLRRREPVWLESRDHMRERFPDAYDRIVDATSANAVLALPLLHGGEVVGALILGFDTPSAVGATDRNFALLLAQFTATALARVGAFKREHDARLKAELMSGAREEVLGVVAHDLRNPLGVFAGTISLLQEFDLAPADRDRVLGAASRAADQMKRLVNDLVDVTRLETGQLALETEELPVAPLLIEAAEAIAQPAATKRIVITMSPPAGDLCVIADRGRVAQVFSNLLGNAVKFTPEAGRVTLRAWRDGGDVVFEVADNGPGVSQENQARLFDRFWQARASDLRGMGLGLAISKAIVEAQHGRMWVESEVGVGSRFYFALPSASPIGDGRLNENLLPIPSSVSTQILPP